MAATDIHATTEELLGQLFSVRSMPKLYKEDQLSQKTSAGLKSV
jgi:hypothetical protein